MARMMRIHDSLKRDTFPNSNGLARDLEVTAKTIHRDVEFMRDQLSLPIEWDPYKNGYYYSEAVNAFPTVEVSEGELFALLVAQKSLAVYRNTPYEKPLANAFRKISASLQDRLYFPLDAMETAISFKSVGLSTVELETFQIVSRAVVTEQELEFEYRGFTDKRFKKRRIQPWHICCIDNQWYLIGYDLMRKAKRTFLLVRMKGLRLTGDAFKRPGDFDIREHLKSSFGVFTGAEPVEVRVEFRGKAARLVQEKTWHPTQEIKDLGGGRIEYSVLLGDLFEIERWILGWGGEARVLAPRRLQTSIRKQAEAILG